MADSNGNILDMIANPRVANPLAAVTQGLEAARLSNDNKLFQARQAAGQNFLDSINPDGTTNQARLLSGMKANPGTALAAQPSAQAGQTLSADEQQQRFVRLQYAASGAASLLAKYPGGPPLSAVKQFWDQAVADKHVTPEDEAGAMAAYNDDPSNNRQVILQRLNGNVAAQTALQNSLPSVGTASMPQGLVPVTQAPIMAPNAGAIAQPAGGVATNLSPSEKVQTQPTMLPSGQQGNQPVGAKYDAAGNLLPASAAAPSPSNPPRLAGAAGPPGFNPTALPLGAGETIAADVGKYKEDQFGIPQGQQRVQSLQKAQLALEASNTGRGSEGVHNMLATMQTLGIPTAGLADNVASYDTAHKYLMDYARTNGAAAHSDLQLQTAEGANASTGINQQAALDVVHTNIGRERQAIARNMEAPTTGVGYGAHSSKFSTATDPRGFAIDAYKPADLNPNDPKSMVGKMTETERAKFYKSVGIAKRLGLLNPATSAAPPQ
jgi:hypothetical protein